MRASFAEEMAKYRFALPIMDALSTYLATHGHFNNQPIAWHCHLTEITAAAAETLIQAGARLTLSECNPATTCDAAVQYMRSLGIDVFLGPDSCDQALAARPVVVSDTGLALIRHYESTRGDEQYIFAGSEITTSGITAISTLPRLSLPVLNINGGRLKSNIENFHGVGDGLVDLLAQLTGRIWSGRRAVVIGYGTVGAGVAHYLKRLGTDVMVIEQDPVRQLLAHYDGYITGKLSAALQNCQLIVTATGATAVIGANEWQNSTPGTLFINVGHLSDELDLTSLHSLAVASRELMPYVKEFAISDTHRIYVVADGNPANVVVLSGSPEPTLIHLTTELLCMNFLLDLRERGEKLAQGAHVLPAAIEQQAAKLALRALNLEFDGNR